MTFRVHVMMVVLFSPTAASLAEEQASDETLWRVRFSDSPDTAGRGSDAAQPEAGSVVEGRILVVAADGGVLLEDRAGWLWNITPAQIIGRERTGERFVFFKKDELALHLQSELGDRFQIVTTEHYIIATSGNRIHAQWCGALFERLLRVFVRYWQAAGMELIPPSAPLPVIVHGKRTEYAKSAQTDGGVTLIDAHGYYSMRSNRVVLVDTTSDRGIAVRTRADVQRLITADPGPVSTIVHEATHQIAFNSGLHTRYADNPVWLTEGMAQFFEVPDLRSSTGWRTIGRVNRPRLMRFRQTLKAGRSEDSLRSLIADDERFRDPEAAEAAYAEAWAFTYFLLNTHRDEYVSFLEECSDNTQLVWKSRKQRLDDFERVFGVAPETLESKFIRYTKQLR